MIPFEIFELIFGQNDLKVYKSRQLRLNQTCKSTNNRRWNNALLIHGRHQGYIPNAFIEQILGYDKSLRGRYQNIETKIVQGSYNIKYSELTGKFILSYFIATRNISCKKTGAWSNPVIPH